MSFTGRQTAAAADTKAMFVRCCDAIKMKELCDTDIKSFICRLLVSISCEICVLFAVPILSGKQQSGFLQSMLSYL